MKVKKNGVDWDAIPKNVQEAAITQTEPDEEGSWGLGDVAPTEIQGTWGFFTVLSPNNAYIPKSILEVAFSAARVRPRVTPEGDEYYAIYRSSVAHRVLALEPIPQREAGDEKTSEDIAAGAFIRQYKGLDNVRIESQVFRRIGVTFPCTLVAWVYEKTVYVSQPLTFADWRLTQDGMEQQVRELRQLRTMREYRNGFPGMSFAEKKRR